MLEHHAVKLKKYTDHPRLQPAPTKRISDEERIATKKKREKIADLVKRRRQDGTERAAAAILALFAATVGATVAAQQEKSKPCPRPSTRAGRGPTAILDLGYLVKNIITPQDAVKANLPNLGPSNTLICDANGGVSKAAATTRVN